MYYNHDIKKRKERVIINFLIIIQENMNRSIVDNHMIRVVYCFDASWARHVAVTISSLLSSKSDSRTHYEIICVCSEDIVWIERFLDEIINKLDPLSSLRFIKVDNIYSEAYETRNISTATYLRFLLPSLLPDISKIIYMDVDLIVNGDLCELWNTDISNHYLAGVKADTNLLESWSWLQENYEYWSDMEFIKGRYINAGLLFMNLELLRKNALYERWNKLVNREFRFQDQDIINLTCHEGVTFEEKEENKCKNKDMIMYLPPKYNFMAFMDDQYIDSLINEGIYSAEDAKYATMNPIGIHYAGKKPWVSFNVKYAELWWKYVLSNYDIMNLFKDEIISCISKVYSETDEYKVAAELSRKQELEAYEREKVTRNWSDIVEQEINELKTRYGISSI